MRRDFGTGTCPHCQKAFTLANKNQITCGGDGCRRAQARITDRAWKRGKRKADANPSQKKADATINRIQPAARPEPAGDTSGPASEPEQPVSA